MFGARQTPGEQLATNVVQLGEGLLVIPELLATEPRRGLRAVAEHVQRCGTLLIDETRVVARHAENAKLTAEELEEAAEALGEHAEAAARRLDRMLAQLNRAATAAGSRSRGAVTTSTSATTTQHTTKAAPGVRAGGAGSGTNAGPSRTSQPRPPLHGESRGAHPTGGLKPADRLQG